MGLLHSRMAYFKFKCLKNDKKVLIPRGGHGQFGKTLYIFCFVFLFNTENTYESIYNLTFTAASFCQCIELESLSTACTIYNSSL